MSAATAAIQRLARRFKVASCAYDSRRFTSEALHLEAEGIGPTVDLPQSHARAPMFSERLHAAIVRAACRPMRPPSR